MRKMAVVDPILASLSRFLYEFLAQESWPSGLCVPTSVLLAGS